MARSYGPDFSPILQALQSYADQETRQGAAAFDASTQMVKTTADATSLVRKRREEDENKEFLQSTTLTTPRGDMSAYDLLRLSGPQDALRSMVLSLSTIDELEQRSAMQANLTLALRAINQGVPEVAVAAQQSAAAQTATKVWRGEDSGAAPGATLPFKKNPYNLKPGVTLSSGTAKPEGRRTFTEKEWNWNPEGSK